MPAPRTIPLRRFPGLGTHASAGPSLRFFTPRVSFPFFACVETPPARVIRKRCLSPTYRARDPGCYRDLAGRFTARRRSWDLSFPSQCSSDLRAVTPLRHDRAHLPFRLPPAASFIVAVPDRSRWAMNGAAAAPGLRVAPSNQPCRVIRRPRHGFYAQGRSYSPARTALGFSVLSQVFGVAPPASTSGDRSARASRTATRDVAAAMNVANRRPCPSALSGAVA
jgi:hypothetical protein